MTADAGPPLPSDLPPPPLPPATNGLGLAGFIVSITGLVLTCGILCPVGFVISLFALRREPRGFAIAGAVIGAVGSLFALVVGAGIFFLVTGMTEAVKTGTGPIQTVFALTEAVSTIEEEKAEKGRLPNVVQGNELIARIHDGWKRPLRYEPHEDSFTIRSAGADGEFDTSDDETTDGR